MLNKKVITTLSSILILGGIAGGVIAVEDRYTNKVMFAELEQRVDRKILRDDIRDYQRQMWDMERNYGKEEARDLREYKEIEQKRQELTDELKRKWI